VKVKIVNKKRFVLALTASFLTVFFVISFFKFCVSALELPKLTPEVARECAIFEAKDQPTGRVVEVNVKRDFDKNGSEEVGLVEIVEMQSGELHIVWSTGDGDNPFKVRPVDVLKHTTDKDYTDAFYASSKK
jgi:hypothetical protein